MYRIARLRPSPSMTVALLALFVALGGSAYAVATINGSDLKNRSVAGQKLKKNTVTGTEVNESKLAKVPNANALQGKPPTAFIAAARLTRIGGGGVIKLVEGQTRVVLHKGPFTVTAKCEAGSGGAGSKKASVIVSSTESNSVAFDGVTFTPTLFGNPTTLVVLQDDHATFDYNTGSLSVSAPSGANMTGRLQAGVKTPWAECFFAGWEID